MIRWRKKRKGGKSEGGREGLPAAIFLGGGSRPAKLRTISPTNKEDSKGTR